MTLWRRFDVIMTLSLRRVPVASCRVGGHNKTTQTKPIRACTKKLRVVIITTCRETQRSPLWQPEKDNTHCSYSKFSPKRLFFHIFFMFSLMKTFWGTCNCVINDTNGPFFAVYIYQNAQRPQLYEESPRWCVQRNGSNSGDLFTFVLVIT